jgi:hypothetical protein
VIVRDPRFEVRVEASELSIARFSSILKRDNQALLKRVEGTLGQEAKQPVELRKVHAEPLLALIVHDEELGIFQSVDADNER